MLFIEAETAPGYCEENFLFNRSGLLIRLPVLPVIRVLAYDTSVCACLSACVRTCVPTMSVISTQAVL